MVADAAQAIASGAAGSFTKSQLIGMFYGDFFAWVNRVSLAIQLVAVPRVFRHLGVAGALFVLPIIALGGDGLFACLPLLAAVRVGKILENSTDYPLHNTARHALFLPTSPRSEVQGDAGRGGAVLADR